MTVDTQKLRELIAKATPGPWRWEFNQEHRSVHLVGGKPQYDLTVMDFTRWGMSGAGVRLRELSQGGMELMHKLHDRPDWIEPFPGRAHHKRWCAAVSHPDMQLMADGVSALPALLDEIDRLRAELQARKWQPIETAPKDGTEILLSNGREVAQGWWMHKESFTIEHRDLDGRYLGQTEDDGYTGWFDHNGGMQPDPTHWMPLPPAPPQGEKE